MNHELKLSRRWLFGSGSAALAGIGVLASPASAALVAAKQESFPELPDFRYLLEQSRGWTGPGGSAKEVTVDEFPISKSIAGVSMRLAPGGLCELHWHAIAAEWAYIVEGRCRVTVYEPNSETGAAEADVADFGPGDTWYFPKGHGHSIQGLGPGECHFILGFDDGEFSEFGTFSITDWLAQTSPSVLTQNLGLASYSMSRLPRAEAYIVAGKVPPANPPSFRDATTVATQIPHKYSLGNQPPVVFSGGEERIVSSREFPIQSTLTSLLLTLQPGALRELHWHPNADEWDFVISGSAEIGIFGAHARSKVMQFQKGDVAFIKQCFGHYIKNTGDTPLTMIVLLNSPFYQEVSLSGWLGANPAGLVSDNLNLSPAAAEKLATSIRGIITERVAQVHQYEQRRN
jgi:oxalate decarboxylase